MALTDTEDKAQTEAWKENNPRYQRLAEARKTGRWRRPERKKGNASPQPESDPASEYPDA